jgi:hypothetical protein
VLAGVVNQILLPHVADAAPAVAAQIHAEACAEIAGRQLPTRGKSGLVMGQWASSIYIQQILTKNKMDAPRLCL